MVVPSACACARSECVSPSEREVSFDTRPKHHRAIASGWSHTGKICHPWSSADTIRENQIRGGKGACGIVAGTDFDGVDLIVIGLSRRGNPGATAQDRVIGTRLRERIRDHIIAERKCEI